MPRPLSHAVAWLSILSLAHGLNPIDVQSQDFVDTGTGDRFEIIGVDYQPGGEAGFDPSSGKDPLSNGDICLRDAALMQAVGFNTIRAYNLDPDLNHDQCASIFNEVGIYMIIDVNSPLQGQSINRDTPATSYTLDYLKRTFKVVDAFRGYPNTLGFFSANEIINDWPTASKDPPYIRAVTRDLKGYIAARGGRSIPVGYSAADFRPALVDTSAYLQCSIEGDPDSRSDFFALNSYSWCGNATFQSSTYAELAADFADTTIPVFFSEYGCIIPSPRYFTEVPVLYGKKMITWSGGLVYQWTEEVDGYGLVKIKDDGSVQRIIDLDNLQLQYDRLNITLIQSRNSTARSLRPSTCQPGLIGSSQFSKDFDLPIAPDGTQELIDSGVHGQAGSLIPVTKTEVQVVVTQVDGSTSKGLTITRVSSANRPHSTKHGNSSPTSDSSSRTVSSSSRSVTSSSAGSSVTSSSAGSSATSKGAAAAGPAGPSTGSYVGMSLASFFVWLWN